MRSFERGEERREESLVSHLTQTIFHSWGEKGRSETLAELVQDAHYCTLWCLARKHVEAVKSVYVVLPGMLYRWGLSWGMMGMKYICAKVVYFISMTSNTWSLSCSLVIRGLSTGEDSKKLLPHGLLWSGSAWHHLGLVPTCYLPAM